VSWAGAAPTAGDLLALRRAVHRTDPRGRMLVVDAVTQIVLLAGEPRDGTTRSRLRADVAELAQAVREQRPAAEVRFTAAGRARPGEPVAALVARLREAGPEPRPGASTPRHVALDRLLDRVDLDAGAAFADEQLGVLEAHDRRHGTDLLHVLELALASGHRSEAASAAYMHRNTFRRQLRLALGLLEADLDVPGERLALHLAVELRRHARVEASTASGGSGCAVHRFG
jgi:DNA-binding PucR family transcriptional regulator